MSVIMVLSNSLLVALFLLNLRRVDSVQITLSCPEHVPVYDTFQVTANMPDGFTGNPFNASQLTILGRFASTSPLVVVNGFVFQNYSRSLVNGVEVDVRIGDEMVAVRYTPESTGAYSLQFEMVDIARAKQYNGSCDFTAVENSNSGATEGYVRVGANKQHFAVGSLSASENETEPWFGVGENLAWTTRAGLYSFDAYFQNLTDNGANYVRVWLTDSWDDLYLETQLGNYSLSNAWHVDQLLESAHEKGIRVLMCIESFNLFCTNPHAPCSWSENVYGVGLGGFLEKPEDFFVNPEAALYFQMRLHYIISRYAHSPSVFAWELFNEVDITDHYNSEIQATWVGMMARYISSVDPYNHLISTSLCCHDDYAVNSVPEVSFSMTHSYSRHTPGDMADDVQFWSTKLQAEYSKPTYVAETGELGAQYSGKDDPSGIGMKNAMWASAVSLGASTAMTWWWDSWVQPFDLYTNFYGISKFTAGVPWTNYNWTRFTCTDAPPDTKYTCAEQKSWGKCGEPWMRGFCCKTCFDCVGCDKNFCTESIGSEGIAHMYARLMGSTGAIPGQRNTTAVLWIQNINNTYAKQNMSASYQYPLLPIESISVTLPWMEPNETYNIQWVNTTTGSNIDEEEGLKCASCDHGCCVQVTCPTFLTDVAGYLQPSSSR